MQRTSHIPAKSFEEYIHKCILSECTKKEQEYVGMFFIMFHNELERQDILKLLRTHNPKNADFIETEMRNIPQELLWKHVNPEYLLSQEYVQLTLDSSIPFLIFLANMKARRQDIVPCLELQAMVNPSNLQSMELDFRLMELGEFDNLFTLHECLRSVFEDVQLTMKKLGIEQNALPRSKNTALSESSASSLESLSAGAITTSTTQEKTEPLKITPTQPKVSGAGLFSPAPAALDEQSFKCLSQIHLFLHDYYRQPLKNIQLEVLNAFYVLIDVLTGRREVKALEKFQCLAILERPHFLPATRQSLEWIDVLKKRESQAHHQPSLNRE